MKRFTWASALLTAGSLFCNDANAQETRYSGSALPLTTTGDEKRFVYALSEILSDAQVQVDRVTAQFELIVSAPVEAAALTQRLAQYGITLSALTNNVNTPAPAPRDLPTNEQLTNANPGERK